MSMRRRRLRRKRLLVDGESIPKDYGITYIISSVWRMGI